MPDRAIFWLLSAPFWLIGWAGFSVCCGAAWLFACCLDAADRIRKEGLDA